MTVSEAPSSSRTTVVGKTAASAPARRVRDPDRGRALRHPGGRTRTRRHATSRARARRISNSSGRTFASARSTSSGWSFAAASRVRDDDPLGEERVGLLDGRHHRARRSPGPRPVRRRRAAPASRRAPTVSMCSMGAKRSRCSPEMSVRRQSSSRCDEGIGSASKASHAICRRALSHARRRGCPRRRDLWPQRRRGRVGQRCRHGR